jgi:hypothetical protein
MIKVLYLSMLIFIRSAVDNDRLLALFCGF